MKKCLAWLAVLVLLCGCAFAHAEETEEKYHTLRVGTTTPFSGNFFSAALGNNVSDLDVRQLIHSYSLVDWKGAEGVFQFDPRVVTGAMTGNNGQTYTLALAQDLTYCDGTPITAADYVFSLLLQTSKQLEQAAGGRMDGSRFKGYADYYDGKSKGLAGVRLLGEYLLSVTFEDDFNPYFYELQAIDVFPLPIQTLAPGCTVKDDGQGAYIDGNFSANVLKKTLTAAKTGYMSHPSVTTGPYMLQEFDGEKAVLTLNPRYKGDEEGKLPYISEIVFQATDSETVVSRLAEGELDLAVRVLRNDQVTAGMQLTAGGDFAMASYSRNGLGLISFCAEKGITADLRMRQALAMCVDRETLIAGYLGGYGIRVDGYYGIGQWMYMMANGTLVPGENDDAEAWAQLGLDGLTRYDLNTEGAARLFADAGWVLDENGNPYDEAAGGTRYRIEDGKLKPLKVTLAYPEGNGAGPLMEEVFGGTLAQAGGELATEALPMDVLLKMYYGQMTRHCDMILLGTNFSDVFDPSAEFEADGTNRLNGVNDPQLLEICLQMRHTEPGDVLGYCQKWIEFQNLRTADAMEIPLYSNAYFDFHISALRNYEPGAFSSWAKAIPDARLSDYEEAEETEEDLFEEN